MLLSACVCSWNCCPLDIVVISCDWYLYLCLSPMGRRLPWCNVVNSPGREKFQFIRLEEEYRVSNGVCWERWEASAGWGIVFIEQVLWESCLTWPAFALCWRLDMGWGGGMQAGSMFTRKVLLSNLIKPWRGKNGIEGSPPCLCFN